MAVKAPPIQQQAVEKSGFFPKIWLDWFRSIHLESQKGFTGTFTNGDGDTVTVENGKITDVS